jgi:transposase
MLAFPAAIKLYATKHLEEGLFCWPGPGEATGKLALAPEAFALLAGGVDLKRGTLKPWYQI